MANKRAQEGNQGQHGEINRSYIKQDRMHTNRSYSHACLWHITHTQEQAESSHFFICLCCCTHIGKHVKKITLKKWQKEYL